LKNASIIPGGLAIPKSSSVLKSNTYISVIAHMNNQRGCEVIVGDKSHILLWEQSGAAQVEYLVILVFFLVILI